MWHHGSFRGDELIVLGYNPDRNECMVVRVSGLPMNEQSDLRRIAGSKTAQNSNYLIPILTKISAPDGQDWFSYLAQKRTQRNSPVFTLPMKEIQDTLDPDQRAFFKGYGKGRINQSDKEDYTRQRSINEIDDDIELEHKNKVIRSSINELEYDEGTEKKIDILINESKQTQKLLSDLIGVLTKSKQKPKTRSRQSRITKSNEMEISNEA
jgi:hypothetical protein